MSKQLSAADNHIITINDGRWRLSIKERPTAEASALGLRYGGKFARLRRLPAEGLLDQSQVQQVVLGWQQTDEAWHLGIILNQALSEQRGSRWVELAHWPDPEQFVFEETANEAGQSLADVLGVSFRRVQPRPVPQPEPEAPLPDPPFTFGVWQMRRAAQGKSGYIIERLPRWRRMKYGRVLWYALWMVIYFVLSIATINSDIALPNAGTLLPNPQLLPYIGLLIALFLACLIVWQLLQVARRPNLILIDPAAGQISAWTNQRQRWVVEMADVQSVYVSEVVKRRERGAATEHGELNLHIGGGKFRFVLKQDDVQSDSSLPEPEQTPRRNRDDIIELTRSELYTDLQAAGMTIATAFGHVATWYDLRVK